MAFVLADRVKQTATTTGTGNFTLSATPTGYRAFSSVLSVNDTLYYTIAHQTANEWEVGYGTYSSANTLTRSAIISSSNSGSAVSFTAGTKDVFITLPATGKNGSLLLGTSSDYNSVAFSNMTAFGIGTQTTYGNSVAVGTYAVAGDTATGVGFQASANAYYATAIGGTAQANNQYAVAVGAAATANGDANVAVGQNANANNLYSIAIGSFATANTGDYGVSVGAGSNAANGATALGYGATALSSWSIAIGAGANVPSGGSDGISIGHNAATGSSGLAIGYGASSAYANTTVIGDSLSALTANATYMNRFRTGVTPVGTAWTLTWDDSTKEVYAASSGPAAATWYTYQDNDGTPNNLNLDLPAGVPTSGPTFNTTYLFGSMSPSDPNWSYAGNPGAGVNNVYQNTSPYPLATPISGGPYFGAATCYYPGPEADPGAASSISVATGTSPYSSMGSSLYTYSGFPVFGSTRTGHYIAIVNGNYVGGYTAASGCTLSGEFYDSNNNYTYFFIDLDATAVSNLSSGLSAGGWSGFASYQSFFWYTYA